MIQFFVACTPRGKQRARVTRHGTYTPKETVDLERLIGWECKKVMAGAKPLEGPLYLSLIAIFPKPDSWSKKKKAETQWHSTKPDLDNVEKLVKDALNKIAWKDDAQVCYTIKYKHYEIGEGTPGFAITIDNIGDDFGLR